MIRQVRVWVVSRSNTGTMVIMRHFACDFETTVAPDLTAVYNESNESRRYWRSQRPEVWLAAAVDVDDPDAVVQHFYTLDDFMAWVFEQDPSNFWFHNMEKFDGAYITTWLGRNGFHHVAPDGDGYAHKHNLDNPNFYVGSRGKFTVYKTDTDTVHNFYDSKKLLNGSIRSLGEMVGHDTKGDETPLVKIGDTLTSTPHRTFDGAGDVAGTPTDKMWTWDEAIHYVDQDVKIMATVMREMNTMVLFENGVLTEAKQGDAALRRGTDLSELDRVHDFKAMNTPRYPLASRELIDWHERMGKLPPRYVGWDAEKGKPLYDEADKEPAPYVWNISSKVTNDNQPRVGKLATITAPRHPALKDKKNAAHAAAANELVQDAYKGGLAWVNPPHRGRWIDTPGIKIDINSMYPWIYSTKPLPNPHPSYSFGFHFSLNKDCTPDSIDPFDPETWLTPLCIVELHNFRAVCHDDAMPIIKPRTQAPHTAKIRIPHGPDEGKRLNDTYVRDLASVNGDEGITITLTGEELKYIARHYDVVGYRHGRSAWYGRNTWLEERCQAHVDRWMPIKESSKGARKKTAKLQLNTPYGKMGEFIKERTWEQYTPVAREDGTTGWAVADYGKKMSGRKDADLPSAAYITAYGRVYFGETVNKVGVEKFAYGDTDGGSFLGVTVDDLIAAGVDIHPTRLGAWDVEATFTRSKFLRAKTYGMEVECDDGSTAWVTTCAGFSKQIPPEDFEEGLVVIDKQGVQTETGTLIMPYRKTIASPQLTTPGEKHRRLTTHRERWADIEKALADGVDPEVLLAQIEAEQARR